MPKLIHLRPMLEVRDVEKAAAFYTDRLGFSCSAKWEHGGRVVWCEVQRDDVAIMLNLHHTHDDDDGAGGEEHGYHHPEPLLTGSVYINVDDVDALWEELRERDLKVEWEPQTFEHGMREIGIRDLDNYLVVFGMPAT